MNHLIKKPNPGLRRCLEIRQIDYLADLEEINRLMAQACECYEGVKKQALFAQRNQKQEERPWMNERALLHFSSDDVIDQSSLLFHQLWSLEIQIKRLTKIKKVFSDYLSCQEPR